MIKNIIAGLVSIAMVIAVVLVMWPRDTGGDDNLFKSKHEYVYKRMGDYIYRGEEVVFYGDGKMTKEWIWEAIASAYVERADTTVLADGIIVADTLEIVTKGARIK